MDWKDYFKLSVWRETPEGSRPYFQSELKVPEEFSIDELLMEKFDHLKLSERERKRFSLHLRKIFLRHHYFKSLEFKRIVENFSERLHNEKDVELTFSTNGGGIYLFMALLQNNDPILKDKRLKCYSSEIPLDILKIESPYLESIQFFFRSHSKSYLKDITGLWQNSQLIDLFDDDAA